MRIQSISLSNCQTSYKGNLAKKTLGSIATGLVAATTLGKHKFETQKTEEQKTEDNLFFEDLSDVEEVDDNIFDEEYYQAYYNIDLNLAKNRAFRDNELFNPLRDDESIGYKFYDFEDVKTADNLIYKNKINEYTTEYKLSDTDFGDMKLPGAIKKPKAKLPDDLRINSRYAKLNKQIKELGANKYTKECILSSCKKDNMGYYEVDFDLVDVAVRLLKNSKHHCWGYCEDEIINLLKTDDEEAYENILNIINEQLYANLPNSRILDLLSITSYMQPDPQ